MKSVLEYILSCDCETGKLVVCRGVTLVYKVWVPIQKENEAPFGLPKVNMDEVSPHLIRGVWEGFVIRVGSGTG